MDTSKQTQAEAEVAELERKLKLQNLWTWTELLLAKCVPHRAMGGY